MKHPRMHKAMNGIAGRRVSVCLLGLACLSAQAQVPTPAQGTASAPAASKTTATGSIRGITQIGRAHV